MTTDERLKEIRQRLDKATPGPWSLCHHLQSVEKDKSCPCGFRGVIGYKDFAICEMGSTVVKGEEGLELSRVDRSTEIANAHLIAHGPEDIKFLLELVEKLMEEKK